MKALLRRLSSVRVRLTLWNTLTLALVLITLGIAFRFLAENYLRNALDREMRLQARRYQESHRVEMFVLSNTMPVHALSYAPMPGLPFPYPLLPDETTPKKELSVRLAVSPFKPDGLYVSGRTTYRIVTKIGAPPVDESGTFLYRSFDLEGRPLAPLVSRLPFSLSLPNDGPRAVSATEITAPDTHKEAETYRPWDQAGFARAVKGAELFSRVDSAGTSLRVLSLPLRDDSKIIGVIQIATPLGQVYRDIAGLTRTLLLILPLALLVAAGAGVFLTDRALRPVKSLTHAATGIHADQLSQRLPISGADEFDALAAAFNRALDRVEMAFQERERMMEQLRRFTGDASHELRTPLTTIKTNTGVALSETEPSQEHIHALRQIDRAADRMTALVQDLLLLARSDAGQMTLDVRPVSLEAVVREAIEMLPAAPHAPVVVDALQPGLTVCGDADQLCRLFRNLLENAVRFTQADGQIQVVLERRQAQAIVRVRDTGGGIAPEHLPHLGERFYRVDAGRNRRQGGAGLGLAICRSIVASHHGQMAIDSEPGQGTTVTVCIKAIESPGPAKTTLPPAC